MKIEKDIADRFDKLSTTNREHVFAFLNFTGFGADSSTELAQEMAARLEMRRKLRRDLAS